MNDAPATPPTRGATTGTRRPPGPATSRSDFLAGQIALEWNLVTPVQLRALQDELKEAAERGERASLGGLLLERRIVDAAQFEALLAAQQRRHESFPEIERYDVRELLGEGGAACVYRAWDRQLCRWVAIKFLKNLGASTSGRERFHREARAAARLSHANVVTVHDVGEARGEPYIVMELIEGGSLSTVFKNPAISTRRRLELIEKAARGVAAAHENGIVHRDLKPNNILVTPDGEPKVSDFGLARTEGVTDTLTRAGAVLGTPLYMAPEQVRGDSHQTTARTDVYALGVILYEALMSETPHAAATPIAVFAKILAQDIEPLRRRNANVPADLDTICLKSLEKEPLKRYANAAKFADDLRRYLDGDPIRARPPSRIYRLTKRLRKHRKKIALSFAAPIAFAVAIAGAIYGYGWTEQRQQQRYGRTLSHVYMGLDTLDKSIRPLLRDTASDPALIAVLAERAKEEFALAMTFTPGHAGAHLGLARLHAILGEDEAALTHFDEAIDAEPDVPGPYLERAQIQFLRLEWLRDHGSEADHAEIARLCARIRSDAAIVESGRRTPEEHLTARALAALAAGDFARAESLLAEILHKLRWDYWIAYARGHALLHLDRFAEARLALDASLQNHARFTRSLLDRARAREAQGDAEGAAADARRALEVADSRWPGRAQAKALLERLQSSK